MATSAPLDSRKPQETDNPGQEEFDKIIENNFTPQDELAMEERAKDGAIDDKTGKEKPSREELSKAEESPYENKVGSGYAPSLADRWDRSGNRITTRRLGRFFIRNRRNAAIGGLISGIIITIVFVFLAVLPLKILHIVSNLQNHFYASSENAIQKETDHLFSQYIKSALKNCKGTIDASCNPIPVTSNPVTRLYKGWQNAKLEDKIAKKYGIEFQYNRSSGHYLMKAPSLPGDGLNIDSFVNNTTGESLDEFLASNQSSDFVKVNRSQIRQAVKDSLSGETRWKQVMYRFKVGRLLEEKYGIRRCIVFCGITDPLADKADAQKRAAKLFLSERVIQPRGEMLGIVLNCLFDENCHPTDTTAVPCKAGENCELNGAPENAETDTQIRTTLDSLAAKYGIEDVAALDALYKEISENGIQNYFIEKALAGIIGKDAAEQASKNLAKALPVVGWVSLAASVVNLGSTADSKIKKLDYVINSSSAVQEWSMYRTYADEIKTGKVKSTEVGSFTNALGPGDQSGGTSDSQLGGTAGAEATPLYSSLIGGQPQKSATALNSFFSNKAYAASSQYTCNNGQPVPAGSLVCSEEKLGVGNGLTSAISGFFNSQEMLPVRLLVDVWNVTGGKITSLIGKIFGGIFSQIPGVSSLTDLIAKAVSPLMNYIINYLIPNPFSENMSGGRTFDMIAAGADVSGNDYAHNGIGGQVLTDQQSAAILDQQQEEDLQHYKNESYIARIFDKNSSYSPITKLAMALPSNLEGVKLAAVNWLSNPISRIGRVISSMFNPGLAFAATGAQPDPFGVAQYGYPDNDPNFAAANIDSASYWDAHCADGSQTLKWNQAASANISDTTGMPTNNSTNPCLLIQAAAGTGGGLFDSSLLTQDDLGGQ